MLLFNSTTNKNLLFDKVFRDKSFFKEDTEYTIVTGYIGQSTPKELINLGFKKTKVIIGMYGNRIRPELHSVLLRIQKEYPFIRFYYTDSKIHSKIYVWHIGKNIQECAIGSANFSSGTALVENLYRETLYLFDKESEASKLSIFNYLSNIENFLIPIEDYEINLKFKDRLKHKELQERGEALSLLASRSTPSHPNIFGLVTKKGGVSVSSCLNWGFSKGLPLLGDAYIPVSSEFIKNNKDLIPCKPEKENIPIEVLWDDGETMTMLMEGNIKIDGILYPKQISSYKNKSLLGDYLRKRIGEKINKDLTFSKDEIKYIKEIKKNKNFKNINEDFCEKIRNKIITDKMLEMYGRDKIDIRKTDSRSYYFDFSAK